MGRSLGGAMPVPFACAGPNQIDTLVIRYVFAQGASRSRSGSRSRAAGRGPCPSRPGNLGLGAGGHRHLGVDRELGQTDIGAGEGGWGSRCGRFYRTRQAPSGLSHKPESARSSARCEASLPRCSRYCTCPCRPIRQATIQHRAAQAVPPAQPARTSVGQWTPRKTRLMPTRTVATTAQAMR
jgi:hypothetical protein